ncbi:MAG: type II toxin-antitoxin system RelE/ParE family toxin [Patescibacteria group bacterium]|nr:type II toxin-antitoxin system RelE/ParE family toxin [Patescibacteria group bacterium]
MPALSTLTIDYWELNENCSPVAEFIENVEPERARAKIQSTIQLLGDVGMSLITNPKVFRKLTGYDNLYELRVSWGQTAYRILVVIRNAVAYLVDAFKKQKRIELQHIRLAMSRRKIIMNYSLAN